jgi:hypothetical protein
MDISNTQNSDILENDRLCEINKFNSPLIKIIDTYPDKEWDYDFLIRNDSMSIESIKRIYTDDRLIYMKYIFFNDNFTLTEENLNLVKDKQHIYFSSGLSVDNIKKKQYDIQPNFIAISRYCTWDVYLSFPFGNWDYTRLSRNPNITMDIISNNKLLPWDYSVINLNKNLTLEFFEQNIDKPWNFQLLSASKIITLDIIRKYPQFNWSYKWFSENSNVDWEFVCAHPEVNWNYSLLSRNPNITWDIIHKNPQYPWSLTEYHLNPTLTVDVINDWQCYTWSFKLISNNYFTYNPAYYWIFIKKNINKSAFIIQNVKSFIVCYV